MIHQGKKLYDGVLNIPIGKSGPFSITHIVKDSGTKLRTSSFRTEIMGGHESKSISYPYATTWHSLMEDGMGTWMTDLPIEQAQHDRMLDGNVYGTVLIGGLGVGYAAHLIASQPQVERIVVVEQSQDVVDLVWKHLTFPKDVDTQIIVSDLFDYLRKDWEEAVFDCGFYDIWTSDGETTLHETIVPLRKLSSTPVDGPLYCWNEDIMRGQLMVSLHSCRRMLKHPDPRMPQLSLDELADFNPKIGCWHNWKVPYYKAIKNKVFELDDEAAMTDYVRFYGRPDLVGHMESLLIKGVTGVI